MIQTNLWKDYLDSLKANRDTSVLTPEEPDPRSKFTHDGLTFVLTCFACPMQYDVYDEGTDEMMAYFRCRGGYVRAYCPDVGGEIVYEYVLSRQWQGVLDTDELSYIIPQVTKAVNDWHNKKGK